MKIQGGGGREGRIGKEGGERKVGRRRGDEEREEDGGKIVRMQGGRWGEERYRILTLPARLLL